MEQQIAACAVAGSHLCLAIMVMGAEGAGGRWQAAGGRQQVAGSRWQAAGGRQQVAGGRQQGAGSRLYRLRSTAGRVRLLKFAEWRGTRSGTAHRKAPKPYAQSTCTLHNLRVTALPSWRAATHWSCPRCVAQSTRGNQRPLVLVPVQPLALHSPRAAL